MKLSVAVLVLLVVVVAAHPAAIAGPGDPRLINGVLEWPRALANEPFIVVRGDDGVVYYVSIMAARHDAALTSGARVAVIGLEGRTAHEITALGVGVGDSVESALANLQSPKPAPAASAPAVSAPAVITSPTVGAPTTPSVAAPTAPTVPAPTNASPAAPGNGGAEIAEPAAKASTAPTQPGLVPGTRAPANNATAPAPTSPTTVPNTPAPTPNGATTTPNTAERAPTVTAPAPAVTPTTPVVGPYPAVISAPTPPPTVVAIPPASSSSKPTTSEVAPTSAPMPGLARDDRRWTEVAGVVEAVNGRTLVLRTPEGRVAVDMSNLTSNLDRIVTLGSTIRVYGLPIEVRFKAMGFVDSGERPRP